MTLSIFYIRALLYIVCLVLSYYAMSAVNFEKILKGNHVRQAQLLYGLLVLALAYLSASFLLGFFYRL